MAKVGFKDILLRKGEKIAIGIGVALLGLLGLMGLMNVVGAESPVQKVKDFQSQAQRISQGVQAEGQPAEPLPEWVKAQLRPKPIEPEQFAAADTIFEPIHQPDFLRENPQVLPPLEYEYHLITAPMPALDIQPSGDGVVVGVLKSVPKGSTNKSEIQKGLRDVFKRTGDKYQAPKDQRRRRGGTGFGGLPPGAGGMMPGGPGGMMPGGGMPGPGGMMPGGGMPGPGGMMPGGGDMMGGYGMPGMYTGGQREDRAVEYMTPEEAQKAGLPLAQTIYPLRSILVQASFPYKLQIAENRKAMRMPEQKGAALTSGFGPGGGGSPRFGPGGSPGAMPPGVGSPGATPPGMAGPTMPGSPAMPGAGGYPGATGTASGAAYMNNPYPVFDGFEVERRILPFGSKVWSPWTFYDHENEYFTKIRARKWADDPDKDYLLYFLRPVAERMWAPLPMLVEELAKWPDLTMPMIVENIKKLKEAGKQPINPSDWVKRFGKTAGSENPYAPIGAGATGGMGYPGAGGMPGSFGSEMPGEGPGGFGGLKPGMPGSPAGGFPPGGGMQQPGGMTPGGMPGTFGSEPMPEVEYSLMRFLDLDIRPGYSYQYRIRVKMKNPNHNQFDKVSRKSDAKVETLYGVWAELQDIITIPPERYVYAGDADRYIKDVDEMYKSNGREPKLREVMEYRQVQDGRRAVVQFQTWMPEIRIDGSNKKEPIGTWVSAEMPVAPGEYVGRRQLIELPLWSSSQQAYVLRELSGGVKVAGLGNQKHQPKGWPVSFHTLSVLVDFEGGKTKAELPDRTVTDESATEVLVLLPDGKLLVRNSLADQEDPDKKARQETWDKWLERVKQRKEDITAPMEPGSGGGFKRGGGFGGPGR